MHIAMVTTVLQAQLVVCVLLKAPDLFLQSHRNSTHDNLVIITIQLGEMMS
jgi:hypothetical protein